jgi:signal transduction histidine kinase/CheY-like chemotaxis protein
MSSAQEAPQTETSPWIRIDSEHRVASVGPGFSDVWDHPVGVGMPMAEVFGPRFAPILAAALERAREHGTARSMAYGHGAPPRNLAIAIERSGEPPVFTLTMGPIPSDIGADPQDLFASALRANMTEMIAVFDHAGAIQAYNPPYAAGCAALLGREIRVGDSVFEMIAPGSRSAWKALIDRALAGAAFLEDFEVELAIGVRPTYEISMSPLPRGMGVLLISRNVTAAREEARAAKLRNSILEAIPDALVLLDRTGRIVKARLGATVPTRLAAHALIGRSFRDLPFLPHDVIGPAFESAANGSEPAFCEYRVEIEGVERVRTTTLRRIEGELVLAIIRDVTDERRAAEKLAFTNRLATLGTLAAGVAHDLNNPLHYARMNLEMLRDRGDGDPELEELARYAIDGIDQAAAIVDSLRSVSRHERSSVRSSCDASRAVGTAVRLARAVLGRRARLEVHVNTTARPQVAESELVQVVLNLLLNAADALDPIRAASNRIVVSVDHRDGEGVAVTVADNGPGVPHDHRARIFDAFFTTKPPGQGTGLGLAIASQLVRDAGGRLELSDTEGGGATFTVVLPVEPSGGRGLDGAAAPHAGRRPTPPPSRVARVLLVDDDLRILLSLRRALAGHRVTTVASIGAALDAMAESQFDLVISDVSMPERGGVELWHEVRERWPGRETKLVLMTAGALPPDAPRVEHVLHKPFDTRVLLRMLDEMMSAPRRS